jgi:23S rRNA (cytosine1962-C5)-methyltransferase
MKFILPSETSVVRLKLARDRTRQLKQGYPWIYKDWLTESPDAPAGSRALVRDKDGSLLAFGMYDPNCPIVVRVCALEKERLDDSLISQRLEQALKLRRSLFKKDTTGFRLINGEGDGLPGLVCDLYGDCAVLKLDGDGPAGFWNVEGFAEWLSKHAGVRSAYLKFRADAGTRGRVLLGEITDPSIPFVENGIKFAANIVDGQKTGFFFDQRENRLRVRTLAKDKTVLNLFGYTGAFSVSAGAGAARHVTTVDLAKPAIEDSRANWTLNGLPEDRHLGVAADAFEFLAQAREKQQEWEFIIVDPPSFAPAERHVEAAKTGYRNLFVAALRVLSSGGIIAFSSCSSHIPLPLFMEICAAALSESRRRATVLGVYGQPNDHPFPFVCTELQYLKFVLLTVGPKG